MNCKSPSDRLTLDLTEYMRRKNAERRARCKALGLCTSCGDKSRPGKNRCEDCKNL